HRVFNNSSFKEGGRFYGGWWQNVPKDFRRYIRINRKPTVEIDYSGHHLRILYAMEKAKMPRDMYHIEESGFSRDEIKLGILMVLNAKNKVEALYASRKKGIRQAARLFSLLEEHYSPISHHFYTGI